MTLNCTELIHNWVDINESLDFHIDYNGTVVNLDENLSSFVRFDCFSDPTFWIYFAVILVAVSTYSVLFAYILYPRHMASQKQLQLRVLHQEGMMDPVLLSDVFNVYTEGQQIVHQLISEFAGFELIDNLESFLVQKLTPLSPHDLHTLTSRPGPCKAKSSPSALNYFLYLMFHGTLIYATYIPSYMMRHHQKDSVLHYLKTECTYSWAFHYDEWNTPGGWEMEIDLYSLCSPSTAVDVEPFIFSLSSPTAFQDESDATNQNIYDDFDYDIVSYRDTHCYVHEDTLEVRQALADTECCWGCRTDCCCVNRRDQCGKCCDCGRYRGFGCL